MHGHSTVVNAFINDIIQRRRPIFIIIRFERCIWEDTPDLIEMNLRDLGLLENIRKFIKNSYEDAYIQIQTKGGNTGRIDIRKGVK